MITVIRILSIICLSYLILTNCRTGSISGRVTDERKNVPNAAVVVVGTSLGAMTDTLGAYHISRVPVGMYTLYAGKGMYHRTSVNNVRIAPDSISIVDFSLIPSAIPEGPFSIEWKEVIIKGDN